eukprot:gene10802-10879_t
MPAILAVLALVYAFGYLSHSAVPGNNPTYPLGWWGWFDQSMYLRAAQAFSRFDMDPAKHWYPPGYALLGAPFRSAMPGHLFFFPDLACFLLAFLGFASFSRHFAVGRLWAAALFLLPLLDRRLVDAWVVPWTSTPSSALQWVLLAMVAAHVMSERLVLGRAVAMGLVAGLIVVFRPTDVVAAGASIGCAALFDLVVRRPRLAGPLAMVAGGVAVLLLYLSLYLRIYGWHLSDYLAHSQRLGFYYGTLGFKAYTLLMDPRAWFGVDPDHWHEGLFQRAPWLVFGLAGILAGWALLVGRQRLLWAALVAAVVLSTANYLAYIDLLATGIWRYGNVHYLKWTYPGMALLGFVVLREAAVGRRRLALAGCAAALMLCCLRIVPRAAAEGEDYRMALLAGPKADWGQAYFEQPLLRDALGELPKWVASRSFPLSNGIRVLSIRRDFQGRLAWADGDGLGPITGEQRYKAQTDEPMQRLVFANQLRGLAALSVVGSHWVGVHFADPKAFAQATATPFETGPVSDLFGVFSQPWFNFGPFGVALFFLISGLVIPISLGSHTRKSFLVARLMRIYPTYVAGLAIGAAAVFASARYWGLPMPFGWSLLAMNAALVMDLVGRVSIDLVNWTLATELKFYVLMLLAAPLIRRGSLAALFCLAALTLGYNLIWSAHGFGRLQDRYAGPFGMASLEALSVGFMLIGVVFSYHVRGQIGGAAAILAVALLFAMFGYGWQHSVAGPGLWPVGVNYLQGLMVFTTAYLARGWFRPSAFRFTRSMRCWVSAS